MTFYLSAHHQQLYRDATRRGFLPQSSTRKCVGSSCHRKNHAQSIGQFFDADGNPTHVLCKTCRVRGRK